jgi:hypothetical protein
MSREKHTFRNTEIFQSELVNRVFTPETVQAMKSLYTDLQGIEWYTEMLLVVPMNQYGVDAPNLFIGIDPAHDRSGVETFDVTDDIKAGKYTGINYDYYANDVTEKGLAMVCTPAHVPNNEI